VQGLKFAAVGAVGFAVDGGLLFALHRAGMDSVLARGFSFPIAVLVTFCLNRTLTFKGRQPMRGSALLVRYSIVQVAGALTNLTIYLGLVHWLASWRAMPLLPLAVAAACSWLLTYLGSRFVFEGSLR
jgi:putative flippase GtrA